jgi:hypothetical protein
MRHIILSFAAAALALLSSAALFQSPATSARAQRATQERPAWDVTLKTDFQASSNLTVVNQCRNTHTFTVTKENLPFLHFLAETTFTVPGQSTRDLPVRFDTTGMRPGKYGGTVTVKCNTCSGEPTCAQDREILPVRLMVIPGPVVPEGQTPTPSATPQPTTPPGTAPTAGQTAGGQQTLSPAEVQQLRRILEGLERANQLLAQAEAAARRGDWSSATVRLSEVRTWLRTLFEGSDPNNPFRGVTILGISLLDWLNFFSEFQSFVDIGTAAGLAGDSSRAASSAALAKQKKEAFEQRLRQLLPR